MTCQARTQSDGTIRCIPCRRLWDADDTRECAVEVESPRTAPDKPEPFVSALAPDYFRK